RPAKWQVRDAPGCSFLNRPLAKCSGKRVATQNHDASGRHGCLYRLTGKHRLLAAANFEFVAIRVFEKEGVVTRTVVLANFGTLKVFTASVAHEFRNLIHFFARVRPKRDSRAVGTMVLVLAQTEKFQRPFATASVERIIIVARTFVNKPKLRQNFAV